MNEFIASVLFTTPISLIGTVIGTFIFEDIKKPKQKFTDYLEITIYGFFTILFISLGVLVLLQKPILNETMNDKTHLLNATIISFIVILLIAIRIGYVLTNYTYIKKTNGACIISMTATELSMFICATIVNNIFF